jgi:hypothetical protein
VLVCPRERTGSAQPGYLYGVPGHVRLLGPRSPAPPGPAALLSTTPPLSFPQLEGVYEQPGRAFVVTYQGWWLDLTSQQIRQLTPGRGGTFTYGPGWQDPAPAQGQLHFTTNAAGAPVRVTGLGPGRVPVHATRLPVTQREVRIPSQDAVLAGTLTTPPGPGPHPGIVILQVRARSTVTSRASRRRST